MTAKYKNTQTTDKYTEFGSDLNYVRTTASATRHFDITPGGATLH